MTEDVPSPVDLRFPTDARAWAATAMEKRPCRLDFFAAFAAAMAPSCGGAAPARVLELGAGPGFLARHLLLAFPDISYVALDFSAAMHELARERLGDLASRVTFVERSFRDPDWAQGLGTFDQVVTHQAVHELRHKQHAVALHAQVHALLAPAGGYLVCDHFAGEGGMRDVRLYMTVEEQEASLRAAGFVDVRQLLIDGGMALHHAM
jgi:SAM-dependent methyltransferase